MNAVEIVEASLPAPSQLLVQEIEQLEHVVVVRVSRTQRPRGPALQQRS